MKIKNCILILTLLTLTVSYSFAQFTNVKVKELEAMKKDGTVIVAFSDDEATNKIAEDVMASYWKVSKYQVIKQSELQGYLKEHPENYVLTYLFDNTPHSFGLTHGSDTHSKTFVGRAIGDGLILTKDLKKIKRLKPTDAMLYCFIDPSMQLVSEKAEFMRQVGALNAIISFPNLKDNQIGGWKVPTINQQEVISKELWIADEDLNKKGMDESKMKEAYKPYSYKIVSKEEIVKAINEKRKDIVYLASAEYQTEAFMFIIHSAEDNKALFFMGGTKGFDSKCLEKIKNNKVYGQ